LVGIVDFFCGISALWYCGLFGRIVPFGRDVVMLHNAEQRDNQNVKSLMWDAMVSISSMQLTPADNWPKDDSQQGILRYIRASSDNVLASQGDTLININPRMQGFRNEEKERVELCSVPTEILSAT
jgi:hypothetical protein